MNQSNIRVVSSLFALMIFSTPSLADNVRLGGMGGATPLLTHLTAKLNMESTVFEVVPNLGSSGALRALVDGHLEIAVSGRPLKEEEKSKGLLVVFVVRTPHVLATSHARPDVLKRVEISVLLRNKDAAWQDGTPIRIGLRPKSDSETDALIASFPDIERSLAELRTRSDLTINATDQDNADWAEKTASSLVSTTLTQVVLEKRNLRLIALDGVQPTIENLEAGIYPIQKSLYFIATSKLNPSVQRFIEYLRTQDGTRALREAKVLPVR